MTVNTETARNDIRSEAFIMRDIAIASLLFVRSIGSPLGLLGRIAAWIAHAEHFA
jgi:hypothetical protein